MAATQREIQKLEKQVGMLKQKLAKFRTKRKPEAVGNYELISADGKSVTLLELFGKKGELILIHNMGSSCPYCTLWADGFNGLTEHLENRAAFVLESPDAPAVIKKFAQSRGWKFKTISSMGSSFREDLGFSDPEEGPYPGVSSFVRKGNKIFRVNQAAFGPGDNYCVMWDLNDLLPKSDWAPKFKY